MAVINTKYDNGDVVWFATTITSSRQHPCPDCLGEGKWKAVSPAGTEYEPPCPRCTDDIYMSNRTLSLKYMWHEPTTKRLTIGLVRANSDVWESATPKHEYMAHETGIGSGSIYKEADLYPTEEAALTAAEAKANAANTDANGWAAKQYADTLKFSDYQLNDAAVKIAKSETSQLGYRIQYLIEDLKDIDTVAAIKERIAEWEDGQ